MLTSSLLQKYCHLPREANKEKHAHAHRPIQHQAGGPGTAVRQGKCHAAIGEEKRHQPSARCLFLQRGMFPLSDLSRRLRKADTQG